MEFFKAHFIAIIVIGIILNFFAYAKAVDREPSGAMGTAFLLPFLLVPYWFFILGVFQFIKEL